MTWKTAAGVVGIYFALQIPAAMLLGDYLKKRRRALMVVRRSYDGAGGRPSKERALEVEAELRKIERELYRPREQSAQEQPQKQKTTQPPPWAPPLILD